MLRLGTLLVALVLSARAHAGFIDSINPNAATVQNTDFFTTIADEGWYYTPTQSYSLTGIYSYFSAIGNFGTGSRTMTVQIQTAIGGTVLGQGSFIGSSMTGGTLGASFAPVQLTAGKSYFVDFLHTDGMGVNLGQWTTANGMHVATAGATTRLAAWYTDSGDASFSNARVGTVADASLATGMDSGLEPILFFSGSPLASPVPEPLSLPMMAMGVSGLCWRACRHRPR